MKLLPAARCAVPVACAALLLAGCGSSAGEAQAGHRVAAAFYPLAYVAQRVAGGHAEVENLTSPGGEPHDLEPTVGETALISEADLVVYLGGFQPAVGDAILENATGRVLDAAHAVRLRPVTLAGPAGEDQHAAEHGHAAEEAHAAEDDHEHGLVEDPHFWLDPLRMADLADAVAEHLAVVDPENAGDYRRNAADLRADLVALDREYRDGLAECARDTVVVSHDAFGYLAKYGLHLEAIAGLSPGTEPSPAELAELRRLIAQEGVTTVFSETLTSPALAETLAREAGVETAVLDPVEGLTDETAGEDYLSLMRANLAALQRANGC